MINVDLGKCSCPHLYVSGGTRYVLYSKDGVILRLDLSNGERSKVCRGDECVFVGNGRFLIRNGQKIIQTEIII
ncbi:MAG: hypothetical protein J6T42_03430 [Clostridia bacterium]|nr:hypothetical protein [Clostridia bacterium]